MQLLLGLWSAEQFTHIQFRGLQSSHEIKQQTIAVLISWYSFEDLYLRIWVC